MSWKKVISSGSNATLGEVTLASGLNIPLLATGAETSGGLTTHKILTIGTAANTGTEVHSFAQELITGENTTYAINATPPGLGLAENGTNNYQLSIVDGDLLHDTLANVTASQHVKWGLGYPQTGNDPAVIHADNYLNYVYNTITGLGQEATAVPDQAEISTSTIQAWTHVGDLDTGGVGSYFGSPTYAPFSITTTGSISSGNILKSSGDLSASTATVGGNFLLAGVSVASASSIQSSGNWQVNNYLGIQGNFFMDTLGFQESIIQTHTGSHNWGGPGTDTVTTWLGDITVVPPGAVSSSGDGFYGDGSGLTGLVATGFDFSTLTAGNGITTNTNFDFSGGATNATFSVGLDNTTDGTDSGFTTSSLGLKVGLEGVTETFLATSAVGTDQLGLASVISSSLTSSLIADTTEFDNNNIGGIATSRIMLANNGEIRKSYPGASTSEGIIPVINTQLGAIYTASQTNGSVTSVGVSPLSSETLIDGLYLDITSTNNDGEDFTVLLTGTATNLNNTHWTSSDPGNVDHDYLSIAHGGTGAGNLLTGAQNIFQDQDLGALQFGNSGGGQLITIPGNLIIDDGSTTTITQELNVSESFIRIGSTTGNYLHDNGIVFGGDATSSNAIIMDAGLPGSGLGHGRLSLSYAHDSTNATTAAFYKHNLIGVLSGSSDGESHVGRRPGNMRINAGEIELWVA